LHKIWDTAILPQQRAAWSCLNNLPVLPDFVHLLQIQAIAGIAQLSRFKQGSLFN
jgi:hypothetical protein